MNIRSLVTSTAFLALAFSFQPLTANAAVSIVKGATTIPDGEAIAAGDLTIINDRLAFSLAVESVAPWGVPRGAIVDLATVKDGKIGMDRVAFADFIPNNWSAWPNTYQKISILKETADEAVILSERDFGNVKIETTYTLKDNSDRIHMVTKMINDGDETLTDLRSGFTLWPDSGYLFSIPGMAGVVDAPVKDALADRVVAYDEDWSIALHAPYFDNVNFSSKDLYQTHTLAPKETRTFEGWLQVGTSGDLAPIVLAETERKGLDAGQVSGKVSTQDGNSVADAVIVIEKDGKPYAWTMAKDGQYSLTLPTGDYDFYATGKGYSQGKSAALTVNKDSITSQDFADLQAPGTIKFIVTDKQSDKPVDAKITITEGQKPLVEFLGKKVFYTTLDDVGTINPDIAPGNYVFTVASGEGFLSKGEQVSVEVTPNDAKDINVALERPFNPAAKGWYASDMHHHSDQLEGVTPPADVAIAELAAGLDALFLSDHDSTFNHNIMQEIADKRGVVFIPSIELSASWGHFNAYPLNLGEPLQIDTTTATASEIMAEARRLGADAIQVNHPYIAYGYFESLNKDVAPGGFDPSFDLLEINSTNAEDDQKVLDKIWSLWNDGQRYYLSAGSDVHDVWNENTGTARAYVNVDGELTANSFVKNLKNGRAYVTYGPLVQPDLMFGEEVKVKAGDQVPLGFDLMAVNGLKQVELISQGKVVATKTFDDNPKQEKTVFDVQIDNDTWFALVVEDADGKKAYTNPIWFKTIAYEKSAAAAQ